jgi:predicted RNase H-like nuclease (RuvC/YqgF family)
VIVSTQEAFFMPRKKAAVTGAPGETLPAAIACPACKSKISSDGKTLHEKSSYLDELVETDSTVEEVEKHVAALHGKVSARDVVIEDLRGQLEAAKRPAVAPPVKNEKEKPSDLVQGQKPKGKSWWD